MIKVSVFYPANDGEKFDQDYYRDAHMPLVAAELGSACLRYSVDRGLAGGAPGEPAAFVAMCHVFSESIESFEAGMARGGRAILADIANFTAIVPVIQISEVVVP
jgi:uncharacterized protein (TIGR02118 family)